MLPRLEEVEPASMTLLASERLLVDPLSPTDDPFKVLAETIPQIVWTADADGSIDYYNARWFEYTGMTLEQTQGWGWRPVLHPDDLQTCIGHWDESIATGKVYEVEYRFKRASDGAYRWHLGRALPMRAADGTISKWFGTCTDIEDQRLARQALRNAQLDLEAKVAARTAELSAATESLLQRTEHQRVSEERFRAAISGMFDAFYIMESVRDLGGEIVDFRIVELNDAAIARLGRPREELEGRLQSELTDPKTFAFLLHAQAEVVRSRRPIERELRVQLQQDRSTWARHQLVPLGDGLVITSRNTNAEKSHESLLELHSAIVSNMTEGVCAVTVSEGAIIYANPKMEQMLGYSPGELKGLNVMQLYPADEAGQKEVQKLVRALREHGQATQEITNLKKDGARLLCRVAVSTIEHPEHGPVWVGVREDITLRKQSEDAIVRLATIVESAFEAVVGKTTSGVIESWNRGAERLYGFSKEEATGQDASLIVPPHLLEEERSVLAKIKDGETVPPFDTARMRRDGSLIHVVVAVSAIRTSSGELIGVSTIAHDITERMQARAQLDRSLREKEVLLKEIHHRVKNNLQVISSLLKLHSEKVTQAEARAAFEDSQARVRAIGLLHEKLYEAEDLGSVDLGSYARSLISALIRTYGQSAGNVCVQVETDGIHLAADRAVPLGLILNELLTNCFKHAFALPLATPLIRVSVRKIERELELTVHDNGPGLPASFELSDTGSLGLQLVRTLSRQLRGSLRMQTDCGTRSSVTFPEHVEEL